MTKTTKAMRSSVSTIISSIDPLVLKTTGVPYPTSYHKFAAYIELMTSLFCKLGSRHYQMDERGQEVFEKVDFEPKCASDRIGVVLYGAAGAMFTAMDELKCELYKAPASMTTTSTRSSLRTPRRSSPGSRDSSE
jgi:hypothetical protein